jgi:hypothetical protein
LVKYAVLLGYGLFDRSNIIYKGYVDSFASFVNKNNIEVVILSGGHTNPKRPLESEASTISKYLENKLRHKANVLLEERALSTDQNIKFTKPLLKLANSHVTVFCDNIRPPKVMWYILHYWFGLSKGEIENYFLDYSLKFYAKHFTTEQIGKELDKGLAYKNVLVRPYRMRTDIDGAVSGQIASILEINSLYDKRLYSKLIKAVKIKFGIENK